MADIQNPSIAIIPSGYKASTLYSVLPSNGDADLSTSRASEATRVNKDGLIETVASNIPRLDYSDGGCPSYLIEPQSINVLNYSEQFDNAYWINNGVTITANDSISPDGTQTADLLTGVSGGFGVVRFSTWSATNKTASCFAKKGSTNLFKIANVSGGIGGVVFNLDSGTVTSAVSGFEGSIENFGNGWYRCIATDTLARSGTFSLGVTAASESVYIWGAQLEALSFSTSYIPTPDTASSTRLQETASKDSLSNYINSSDGVLYFDVKRLKGDLTLRRFSLSNATNSNIILFDLVDVANQIRFFYLNNGGTEYSYTHTVTDIEEYTKIAFKWKTDDFALWVNGTEVDTGDNGTTLSSDIFTDLKFSTGTDGNRFFAKVKDLRVYDVALSDAELQKLTTL